MIHKLQNFQYLLFTACLLALTTGTAQAQTNSLELDTYYPAPFGNYDRLRLVPRTELTGPCDIGTIYAETGTLDMFRLCMDDGNGNGYWAPLPGVWTQSGNDVYPTDSTNPNLKVGMGTTTPEFRLTLDKGAATPDGGILAIGTYNGGDPLTTSGAGTRFMWYPKRAALRAGTVTGNQWDDTVTNLNIGDYSVAMGYNTTASGTAATAMGSGTTASNTAAVAMGFNTTASSSAAVAMGQQTIASGAAATAMGLQTTASGAASTAMNNTTTASGDMATALGDHTTAQAYASLVTGRYNVITGNPNPTAWVATDPVFVVGNGDSTTRSDAFVVLKNGKVGIGTVPACCGNGSCDNGQGGLPNNGENCATCDTDCGACAACSGSFTIVDACGGCSVGDYFTNGNYCDSSGNDGDASCVNCLAYGNPGCVATLGYCSPPPDCVYNCVNTPGTPAPACGSVVVPDLRLTVANDGGIFAVGPNPIGGTTTIIANATDGNPRLIWYPRRAAFRAGDLDNGSPGKWNHTNIGNYSVAMGQNPEATADTSVSLGYWTHATGASAVALGKSTTASGSSSTAMGTDTTANGSRSTAMGNSTTASGSSSTAMGDYTTANGIASTAMGRDTTAQAYASLVIGQYNLIAGTTGSWQGTEPVFVIGNGASGAPSNALTVLQNGNTTIGGILDASKGLIIENQTQVLGDAESDGHFWLCTDCP